LGAEIYGNLGYSRQPSKNQCVILMSTINDFTDAEQWAVSTTLKERWPKQAIDLQQADVEIKRFPHDRELTLCPALFWQVGTTSFIIIKVGDRAYRSQFYYKGFQQYGTGKSEFDDIADCTTTLLQVHADKETDLLKEQEQQQADQQAAKR